MTNNGVIYAWTAPTSDTTVMDTVPNSVTTSIYSQNVELQNCQNSLRDTAQFFCGRLARSRLLILLVALIIYTLCGAFVFHVIESTAEVAKNEQRANRLREKRNELVDRIVALTKHGDQDLKTWANLTYASLVWYQNELGENSAANLDITESYLGKLLLAAASFTTVGFQLSGPSSTLARSTFVILAVPGIFLYLSNIHSLGKVLSAFYDELARICCLACSACRPRFRPSNRRNEMEHWRDQLSWNSLFPSLMALLIISSAQTALLHYLAPIGLIDSAYSLTLAIFTIGTPRPIHLTPAIQLLLLASAVVWLAHLACLWHVVTKQKSVFKRYLFAWLQQNKEDAIFIKLSLLQPTARRHALANTLLSKSTHGSLYRNLLFRGLTLDDKVALCRHLTWTTDNRDRDVLRTCSMSPNGQDRYNVSVQADLDNELLM